MEAKRLQAYYTKSPYITEYMVSRIGVGDGDQILEPCGGDGEFIHAIRDKNQRCQIDTFEIDPTAVETLRARFFDRSVRVFHSDVLWDRSLDRMAEEGGGYSKIIGNPPYGAWVDYEQRELLRKKFGTYYSKESYTLFLYRALTLLKPGGSLSFIIPDTYLYLRSHENLRRLIFSKFQIDEILIFPSRFFPEVAFGYSNLSILSLKRPESSDGLGTQVFRVKRGFRQPEQLIGRGDLSAIEVSEFTQDSVVKAPGSQLLFGDHRRALSRTDLVPLGEIADCVTGIYTGDNKRFLAIRRAAGAKVTGYPVIEDAHIDFDCRAVEPLSESGSYIPIVKGSSATRYRRESNPWLIRWDAAALEHYATDKKARLQNKDYYFRKGIAVPMVKSRIIRCTEFSGMVFDQSIVGVFAKDSLDHDLLLAFLNTDIAVSLINTLNPTANNSANYLRRIPIPRLMSSEKDELRTLVAHLRVYPADESVRSMIEEIFQPYY
ncbi:Eco57I restriction-modification methylase domain-containing protein [Dermabacteraceae bacterium P13138]